jgi:heterodisulfide reductase subunit D
MGDLEMVNREEHISKKGKAKADTNPSPIESIADLTPFNQEALLLSLDHCIRCNTCKYAFGFCTPSCPSGENFFWESYWASGRIRLARALLTGKLKWNDEVLDPIFSCPTCGACTDNCQAVHHDRIVDIIEALRELAVKRVKPLEKHQKLDTLIAQVHNPYGEKDLPNQKLREQYKLPEKADVVYFIGCTSNFRQMALRDATLSVLRKLKINFTLIDEYCCSSPLIRTGQTTQVGALMDHNLTEIKKTGAQIVITSCAGCYRTLIKDFSKFGKNFDFKVLHMTEFLLSKIDQHQLKSDSTITNKTVTYHDPCHLGHHLGFYEIPRQIIQKIPGIKFIELNRNRKSAWCCGAGGGVKIGNPELALKNAQKRITEVKDSGAQILLSTCPFCKTNLSNANENSDLQILDVIEILDLVLK